VKDRKKKVTSAGTLLKRFIDPRDVLRKEEAMRRPFIIFSFDEAYDLTELKEKEDWSIYLTLRGCLTHLIAFPFFFLLNIYIYSRPLANFVISPQRHYGTLPVGCLVALVSFYLPSPRLASISSHSPPVKTGLH